MCIATRYTEGNPVHDVVDSLAGFDAFCKRRLERVRRRHEVMCDG